MKKLNVNILENNNTPVYLYARQIFLSDVKAEKQVDNKCYLKMMQSLNQSQKVKCLVK